MPDTDLLTRLREAASATYIPGEEQCGQWLYFSPEQVARGLEAGLSCLNPQQRRDFLAEFFAALEKL